MIIESVRPRRHRRLILAFAIAVLGTFAVPEARAERIINSLPFSENFDSDNYSDIVWTSQGATHTHMPTSGFRGGAAKFTPPNAEGYSGLGQFILGMAQRPEQLNVRFLMIDELVIDDEYIGPPEGFFSSAFSSVWREPPTTLRAK